jgi:mycothione reductase
LLPVIEKRRCMMKEYDVVVVGAGCGLSIVYKALSEHLTVALVAREHLGGTCMNVGCVPSKTLLYVADTAIKISEAGRLGVQAEITSIDFPAVMRRMRETRKKGVEFIRGDIAGTGNVDFYEAEGRFIDEYTIEAGAEKIRGKKIFIASGARPAIPPIKGLSDVPYLTNESLLDLERRPESIIIIGGSYIGVEYAHFFAGIGAEVSVVEYNNRLVSFEEPEISELLQKSLEKRMKIYTGHEALSAVKDGDGILLTVRDRGAGTERSIRSETVLIAAGRKSNADRLSLEKTGVTLTRTGFIEVNDYLETSKPGIWAIGDATGKGMFTHAADHEARIAWHNAGREDKWKMNFDAVPHAVFTLPQIASIGMTEAQASPSHEILVGQAQYADTAQSDVRMESQGFAKAIVEKGTERILGFHVIGPDAAILIQEVVQVVTQKASYKAIIDAMHIFPALTELIPETFSRLEEKTKT